MANKYLENQYDIVKNWGNFELTKKESYDEAFAKEFDFICQQE